MNTNIIGYLMLRRLIGVVGIVFPLALLVTVLIMGGTVPGSISDYYYANRVCVSIFECSMALIAGFLFCYRGYDKDYIPVKIASVAMIGVVFFPTIPNDPTYFNNAIGIVHGISAAITFLTLAYISFFLFTKTEGLKHKGRNYYFGTPTKQKLQRNVVYRTCGIVMATAMILIYPLTHWIHVPYAMYTLETIIVEAFALSWLVKGETIWRDKR